MKFVKVLWIDNKNSIMPQIDKEIFVEYFVCIFLVLLQTIANESVSENFFKLNLRFYLVVCFKLKKAKYQKEISIMKNLFKKIC